MKTLNAIIIVVLILMTVYMFHMDTYNNTRINNLNYELNKSRRLIDSLHSENDIITNDVGLLKDSITRYKTYVILYNDSIVKIKNRYETISNNVYILDDSTSYEYFKNYLERYSGRYRKSTH